MKKSKYNLWDREPLCLTCRAWVRIEDAKEDVGECRFHPPLHGELPITPEDHWCLQHSFGVTYDRKIIDRWLDEDMSKKYPWLHEKVRISWGWSKKGVDQYKKDWTYAFHGLQYLLSARNLTQKDAIFESTIVFFAGLGSKPYNPITDERKEIQRRSFFVITNLRKLFPKLLEEMDVVRKSGFVERFELDMSLKSAGEKVRGEVFKDEKKAKKK